jgi:D-arabinose 1-dehydrogenase-like Zn-dependent alcohol dehydrogenase
MIQSLQCCPGPTDVLIKLNATGICHSDLHFMLNDWALPKMSDLGTKCAGHEGAGVIVKVGDQVKTLKPGMRAGFKVCLLVTLNVPY